MNKKYKKQLKKRLETKIPESLEKENILNLLPEKDEKTVPMIHKSFNVKRTLSLVASFILIFGIATVYMGVRSQEKESNESEKEKLVIDVSEVVKYTTYEPIYEKLQELKNSNYYDITAGTGAAADLTDGDESSDIANNFDFKNKNEYGYGTTNTQEQGVDEGDIIKTDGQYIYVISSADKSKLSVVDCNTMKTVSQVELEENTYFFEMYLIENKAVCVGRKYMPLSEKTNSNAACDVAYVYGSSDTVVCVYDVSNKTEPKAEDVFNQSGTYYSSRMIGTKLYCVSTYYPDIYSNGITDACIPTTNLNGEKRKVPANCISVIEDAKTPSYIVISVLDVKSGEEPVTEAVFGNSENVYATVNNLYVADSVYNESGETSNIYKFDYSDNGIKYICRGTVNGRILNQFSMSEQDGLLRVAVTETTSVKTTSKDGMTASSSNAVTTNSLYILDENMQQVGFVTDLAKGETIKSVRFIGDMAYVVTFLQTDPLFVIDLSDPENPTVKGELKITGFSAYLHPVGENLLVGIGEDGTETGSNGDAKISVFDVSDPTSLTEASKITVLNGNGYVYSPVSQNHKCYIALNNNEFLVPFTVNRYVYRNENQFSKSKDVCYIQYKVTGKEITEVARYSLCESGSVLGGTYVGNVFYAVINKLENNEYELVAFDLVNHTETGRVVL